MFKTYSKKQAEVEHKWVLIDAAEVPVGRLATLVATRLTGKYQPTFTPHIDSGDNVVVINADKAWLTGNKYKDKKYYSHSGYHGGITETNPKEVGKVSVIKRAIKGMLPKNKLQADRMARLRVFAGAEHDHTAQSPETLAVGHPGLVPGSNNGKGDK
ncbi:50S ribosomal protein L13 [Alphaproteobacteria bacterium]|nr:50S ribosomal protein L13 [Alphaproteobacteria bacterium]